MRILLCSSLCAESPLSSNVEAFDHRTSKPGDEELTVALFAHLHDRRNGGAFDVLRMYGNFSSLLKTMLGWRGGRSGIGPWLEAQCGGFIVVNENLSNLLPLLPIVIGAGGLATDFEGQPLSERTLLDGRCNVLFAANEQIHSQLLAVVRKAKEVALLKL